jgi:hypothetical protein
MGLNIILGSLTAFIGFFLLILFIPFRLAVSGNIQWMTQDKSGNSHIHLGGIHRGISISPFPSIRIGIGRFDKPLFSFSLPQKKQPNHKNRKLKKKNKSNIPYIKIGMAALREIHFDHFLLNGNLGLPNPMYTGIIYGWSQSIGRLIRGRKVDIVINPRFNNQFETDINGRFRMKFIPGKVLWQAIKTYFKFKK